MGVSFALIRIGGASSKANASLAMRDTTSAVTPPHGNASPTHNTRPVRATDAMMVSVSSGLTVRRSSTSTSVHRSEEHTSELQSPCNLVCRLLLDKKNNEFDHA